MDDVPMPAVSTNEVLVKVEKTAICGTDLHIYNWDAWSQRTIKPPLVIGHEFVGEIVELGPGVHNYQVGDRVSAEGHITCGMCRNCRAGRRHLCAHTTGIGVNRDGAFAEYISVPASNLWLIPDDISSEIAACFDPLGNATHCALSFAMVGEDVLHDALRIDPALEVELQRPTMIDRLGLEHAGDVLLRGEATRPQFLSEKPCSTNEILKQACWSIPLLSQFH